MESWRRRQLGGKIASVSVGTINQISRNERERQADKANETTNVFNDDDEVWGMCACNLGDGMKCKGRERKRE